MRLSMVSIFSVAAHHVEESKLGWSTSAPNGLPWKAYVSTFNEDVVKGFHLERAIGHQNPLQRILAHPQAPHIIEFAQKGPKAHPTPNNAPPYKEKYPASLCPHPFWDNSMLSDPYPPQNESKNSSTSHHHTIRAPRISPLVPTVILVCVENSPHPFLILFQSPPHATNKPHARTTHPNLPHA